MSAVGWLLMACTCFDFCTGEWTCISGPTTINACQNACHDAFMGYVRYRSQTNIDQVSGGSPPGQEAPNRPATCADDIRNDPFEPALVPANGVNGSFDLGVCFRGGASWHINFVNNATQQIQGDAHVSCLPDGYTPFLYFHTDLPSLSVSLYARKGDNVVHTHAVLSLPSGYLQNPSGWTTQIIGPITTNQITGEIIECCGVCQLQCCSEKPRPNGTIDEVSVRLIPARAYLTCHSCFEDGGLGSQNCYFRPCCRRGQQYWPPQPPQLVQFSCGMYDTRITSGANSCAAAGILPGVPGFFSQHKMSRSCWFPGTCATTSSCNTNPVNCDPVPPRQCRYFCMGPGIPSEDDSDFSIMSFNAAVDPFQLNLLVAGNTQYRENDGDCVAVSCRDVFRTPGTNPMSVDANGDDVFIGSAFY